MDNNTLPITGGVPLLPSTDINGNQGTDQTPETTQSPTQPNVPTNATFAPGVSFNGQLMSPSAYGSTSSTSTTPKPAAKPAAPKTTGVANNFIVRNLQNIGDIAGGLAGAELGPGDIATAAAGRGIGEFLKEAIDDVTGSKVNGKSVGISGKNIAEETGLGALSQATGDVGGKLFGKVAGAAGSEGEKLTAQSLFPGVKNPDLIKGGAMSTVRQLLGYGIKAKDLPDAVAQTTGADGIFSAATKRAFNLVKGTLDTGGLGDQLTKVAKYLDYASPGRAKAAMKILSPYGVKIADDGTVTLPKTLSATDAHEIQQSLEGLAYDFTNPQPVKNAIYSAARTFENAIDNTAGATKSIGKFYTDDEIAALNEISPKLAKEAEAVTTIRQSRALNAPFTRAAKLLQASADAAENPNAKEISGGVMNKIAAAGEMIKGYGGVPGRLAAAGDLAFNTPAGKRLMGKAGMTLAKGASNMANKPVLSQLLATTLPQTASGLVPSSQTTGPVSSALSSEITAAQSALNQATNTNGTNSTTGGVSPSDFASLMSQYGTNGMSKYMDYLQMTAPQLSTEQQTAITLSQTSLAETQQLASLYDKAMSSGLVGKILDTVTKIPAVGGDVGKIVDELGKNTPAAAAYSEYSSRRYDVARTLAKLASEGGQSGGMSSIEAIEEQLPTLSDSPIDAQYKFSGAIQNVMTAAQSTLSAPATNTPGQLTNFGNASIPGSNIQPGAADLSNPTSIGLGVMGL